MNLANRVRKEFMANIREKYIKQLKKCGCLDFDAKSFDNPFGLELLNYFRENGFEVCTCKDTVYITIPDAGGFFV